MTVRRQPLTDDQLLEIAKQLAGAINAIVDEVLSEFDARLKADGHRIEARVIALAQAQGRIADFRSKWFEDQMRAIRYGGIQ